MKSATDSGSAAPVVPIQTRHGFRSASATHFPRTCPHATCAELSTAADGRCLPRTHDPRGGQLVFSAQDACLRRRCRHSARQARSMSAMCRIAGACVANPCGLSRPKAGIRERLVPSSSNDSDLWHGSRNVPLGRPTLSASVLWLVGADHAESRVLIQRQLYPLTRAKATQAGAFHVPGDRPSRLMIVNQESQTELGQNLMRSRYNERSAHLGW